MQENKVIIVDEFTGRLMTGRRWSDGLHQAVEAKEGVEIEIETQTLATITLQNYFRMYKKLSGMTGTAETEAGEFTHTYKHGCGRGPHEPPLHPRRPGRRDLQDQAREVQRRSSRRSCGCTTRSCRCWWARSAWRSSELLSRMLARTSIPHNVLNAKNHQREAEIVRFAGQPGAVTIATNMAGRGTDIKLHPDVVRRGREGRHATAACRSSAPSATRRAASTASCAAAAGRQGDPGLLEVLPVARGRPDAPVRQRAHRAHHGPPGPAGGRGDHPPLGDPRDRERAEEGGGAQLRACASAPSTTTT